MSRAARSIGWLCLWLCWPALHVSAQAAPATDGQESVEYQRAIDAALEEYKLSHFEEARSLFERAHGIEPNARTLRGLGMVEFELRHYLRAQALLEQALASTHKPLTVEQRASVTALLERTRQFIARLTLQLTPPQQSFELEVDGQPAELGAGGVLSLISGEHTVQLRAAGFAPRTLSIDAKGGDQQTLRVELEPVATPRPEQPAATPAPPPVHAEKVRPYRKLGIVLASAGAASLGTSALLGGLALAQAERSHDGQDHDAERARTLAISSDVTLAVGIAAAIAGTVCLVYKRELRPASRGAGARLHGIFPTLRVSF